MPEGGPGSRSVDREALMYREQTVGVVVPAYNEEGFVGDVVETMPDVVDRVYVVDDRSTDDTWAEIRATAERVNDQVRDTDGKAPYDPVVVPIRHNRNRGPGGAIKTGYLRAREDDVDVTAVMGGDGQMDPEVLPSILDPVVDGTVGYAKGDRLASPELHRDMGAWRLFGNRLLTWLTRIASGYWTISDPQNGYAALSAEALEAVDVEGMYEYYGYCNDLLVRLNVADVRVADVPMEAVYGDEESSITYPAYIPRVSYMLLRDFLWRLRESYLRETPAHPVPIAVVLGAASVVVGVAGLLAMGLAMVVDDLPGVPGRVVTGLLLFGTLATSTALVGDSRMNGDKVYRVSE
jgi:glycosyltransferase involved in cell wall biosynthesis